MNKSAFSLLAAAVFISAASRSNSAVILTETFTYPDGALVGAAGSPWVNHSGTAGQVDVAAAKVALTGAESEDVSAPMSGSPYSSATILTATFDVNFSVLPAGAGTYFAHFKDSTTGFRARTTASVTGAGAGFYRLGIGNDADGVEYVALDLSLGTSYAVTITWNTDTNQSSISINGGAAVINTDPATSVPIQAFALRQSTASGSSMGALVLDNLQVNSAAVPEPASALLGGIALSILLARRRRHLG
jgi:hypothetical protein